MPPVGLEPTLGRFSATEGGPDEVRYGLPGAGGVVVTVVVGVIVVVLVVVADEGGVVVVGLPAGGTGAPVVSVTVDVLVDIDVEVLATPVDRR